MTQARLTIDDAAQLASRLDQQAVVILGVERDGTVTVVSYGEDKAKCRSIGDWAQGLWSHAVAAVPFRTMFGWGNDGRPKRLTDEELAGLTTGGVAYAQRHTAKDAE